MSLYLDSFEIHSSCISFFFFLLLDHFLEDWKLQHSVTAFIYHELDAIIRHGGRSESFRLRL